MAEIASPPEPRFEDRAPAPRLEIVRAEPAPIGPTVRLEREVVRAAVIGYLVGFVVVTTSITAAATMGGVGFVRSLAFAGHVGLWGGGGFGFMIGATLGLARRLDEYGHGSPPKKEGST
jgi:hypothetical protein